MALGIEETGHTMECELVLGEWVLLFIEMVFSFAGRRVSNL